MQTTTVRGVVRGTTATLAVCAALAAGAATAGAAPLTLEPATETSTAPVSEQYTSSGSSTISATVHAKFACVIFTGTLGC
ncbi:hypothetical protein IU485_07010 [Nocardia cyriacigeorgica]|uniref:hypothetical protein n=1 Tax=Nocardia cyriacigeorgica TaxID=135487 RepID=UPI0018931B7E|nr:hypothetical protein [Nocardia cyriacigeorgica]MBF6081108.1 hypothetical protein [Nocardia cyriacigeorgica]